MNHAAAVSSIANKRIRLTREDVYVQRLVSIAFLQSQPLVHVALQRQDEVDP
jgi:hypothetical protein